VGRCSNRKARSGSSWCSPHSDSSRFSSCPHSIIGSGGPPFPSGPSCWVTSWWRPASTAYSSSIATHADLHGLSDKTWNEIVVDGRGNYVNGVAGTTALVGPDGSLRRVADGLAFPNGMAVTADNATLIVAESHARRLTAFEIAADGGLSNRRVWADLGDGVPDGICLDADNAVWYGDVPNKRCARVREGGAVLQTIDLDRGCFACTLGGTDKRTLFLIVAEWRGMEQIPEVARARTGQVLTVKAPAPGVGWP
jgi:sugar lactone lactonase YvrE